REAAPMTTRRRSRRRALRARSAAVEAQVLDDGGDRAPGLGEHLALAAAPVAALPGRGVRTRVERPGARAGALGLGRDQLSRAVALPTPLDHVVHGQFHRRLLRVIRT